MIELTLSQLLREKTRNNPEQEFMVYADRDLRFTYAQFDKRVDDLACGLMQSVSERVVTWGFGRQTCLAG